MPPDWKIGAKFRCTANPDGSRGRFAHRIYKHPPHGGHRARHILAADLYCDFTKTYTIKAIFVSQQWLAVQFEVDDTLVWTNVRKNNEWWAEIVP